MESETLQVITSAVAPIVMVSAAGVLSMGVQAKNLHLADRLRALMGEYRTLPSEPGRQQRREEIIAQLTLFRRRIALSQRAFECNYVAMATFVVTSLLLVATPWLRGGGGAGRHHGCVCGQGLAAAHRAGAGVPGDASGFADGGR